MATFLVFFLAAVGFLLMIGALVFFILWRRRQKAFYLVFFILNCLGGLLFCLPLLIYFVGFGTLFLAASIYDKTPLGAISKDDAETLKDLVEDGLDVNVPIGFDVPIIYAAGENALNRAFLKKELIPTMRSRRVLQR